MPPSPIQKAGTPPVECPRCHSLDTKFCYYNNYNLSQPRHFCKSCRRYWTLGGTLRNVPVGGTTRRRADSPSCSHPAKRRRHNPKQDTSEEREEPPVLTGQVAAAEPLAFLEEVGCFGLDLGLGLGAMEDLGFGVGRMEWQFPSEEIDIGGGVGVETWPLEGGGGEEVGCFAAAPDLPVSSEGKGVQQ